MGGLRAALRDQSGNVAMMYALVAPVLLLASGAAIDYGRSASIQSELNAAADAAALAALTPAMMQQSASTAQAAAQNMFIALTSGISGIPQPQPAPSVAVGTVATTGARNVTVTYSTSVSTLFGGVTGRGALPISGSSTATAHVPPNLDFYVLLDNSPSMVLPATADGVTQMQNLTIAQGGGGCAFACHQASTGNGDTVGNLCLVTATATTAVTTATTTTTTKNHKTTSSTTTNTTSTTGAPTTSYASPGSNGYCTAPSTTNSTTETTSGPGNVTTTVTTTVTTNYTSVQLDNYAMARYNNITLRIDELNSGMTTLLQTAATTRSTSQYSPPPQYRFAVYSMDSLWQIGMTELLSLTTGYQSAWTTASANFGVMEMFSNNVDCANSACSSGTSSPGGDVATNYDNSLGDLSQTSYIPNPGTGTNQAGDTPQEVLFIVTDGVEDELSGGNRLQQAINNLGNAPGGTRSGTNWCTAIKNRGIKIAILYTEYLPVPANSWYESWIAPVQSDIGPALQACSSGPSYFYDAAIGDNLGQDLTTLFNAVVQSAHLTQ